MRLGCRTMSQLLSIDLPECARSVQLDTSRGTFAALDADVPAPATQHGTALLVPGFMGSKEDFLTLIPHLNAGGMRVVAIDGRGQYESGEASASSSYTRDDLALDLVAIVQALDDGPVHLVGHSYGGIAARAAVINTGGDKRLWSSLTLINFGPGAVSTWQQERLRLLLSVIGTMSMADIWPHVKNTEVSVPENVSLFLEKRWLRTSPNQLAAAAEHMLSEQDSSQALARTLVPIAVVSGTPDETWEPTRVEAMAHNLGAQFIRIEGGGHSPNVHKPQETATSLLRFWQQSSKANKVSL